jgi:hypothetical protein
MNRIFFSGTDLDDEIIQFLRNSDSVSIFSAYIKLETLKHIIEECRNVKFVLVRWQLTDIQNGSSDLTIYPYLKQLNIPLLINQRLHFKVYKNTNSECIITSANISSRAYNVPRFNNFNHEVGSVITDISRNDEIQFEKIVHQSHCVDDSIYELYKNKVDSNFIDSKNETPNDNQELNFFTHKRFTLSDLPMSSSISVFTYLYFEEINLEKNLDYYCFIHDMAKYNIPLNLSQEELKTKLINGFLENPFINALLNHIKTTGELYFGEVKSWIHHNCSDSPLPRKWEITENIQILFQWLQELDMDEFCCDRPNYSQRVRYVAKS